MNPVKRFSRKYPFAFSSYVRVLFAAQAILAAVVIGDIASATHDPNDFFVIETMFPSVQFRDLHGISTTVMFAGGGSEGNAYMIKRSGGTWVTETIPLTPAPIDSIWVVSASLAFATLNWGDVATAQDMTYLKWNGAVWTTESIPDNQPSVRISPRKVSAVSSTNIMFGGNCYASVGGGFLQSCIRGFDGTTYGTIAPCTTTIQYLFTNGANPYDVGHGQATIRERTSGPSSPTCGGISSGGSFNDAWGPAGNSDRILVGTAGQVEWDRASILDVPFNTPTQAGLRAVWGTSTTDVWAVGGGAILHSSNAFSGAPTWTLEPSPVASSLFGVYFPTDVDGWAVSINGEVLKFVSNAAVAVPNLAAFAYDPDNIHVTASQAQCNGDATSLSFNHEPPISLGETVTGYVIDSETNIVIEVIPQASFFNLASKFFHIKRPYPTGEYQFLVTIDRVLPQDHFMGTSFSVPRGTCIDSPTDLTDLTNRVNALQTDVDWINATTLRTETNVTEVNATVNDGLATTLALINNVHTHIDAHFAYTNQLFNDTFEEAVFNITVGADISNQTVKLLVNELGLALGETTTLNILIILLMVVIGVWMYRKKEHDLPIRLAGVLIVLTAATIALSTATAWSGGIVFAAMVVMFGVGLMLYGLLQIHNQRNDKRRKGDLKL